MTYLIHELSFIMTHEENSLVLNDSLSNKIILFSMITLITMVLVGVFQTMYLHRFLENKKAI